MNRRRDLSARQRLHGQGLSDQEMVRIVAKDEGDWLRAQKTEWMEELPTEAVSS